MGGRINASARKRGERLGYIYCQRVDDAQSEAFAFAAGGGAMGAVNGGSENEVAHNDLGGEASATAKTRCFWALATSRVFVRCSMPSTIAIATH